MKNLIATVGWKPMLAAATAGFVLVRNSARAKKVEKRMRRDGMIAELYEAGYQQVELAGRFQLGQSRISTILNTMGVRKPNRHRHRQMWNDYLRGSTVTEVAENWGVSRRLASLILRRISDEQKGNSRRDWPEVPIYNH